MAFVKVDLRSFEDVERLPRPAGGGRASREFCLHEPIENPVARRRQLLQTGVERRGRCFSFAAPCPAEGLHGEAEPMIAFNGVFSGVFNKFVGKRFGLIIIRACQIHVEARPGQRHTQGHGVIELACFGDRHSIEPPRMIGRAAQPNQVGQNAQGIGFTVVAKSLDKRLSRGFVVAVQ